jgi:hypothetical protein
MSKRSEILNKCDLCVKHTISLVKFLLGEKSHFHHKRIQFTAHVCMKAKLAEIMGIQGRIDNLCE